MKVVIFQKLDLHFKKFKNKKQSMNTYKHVW